MMVTFHSKAWTSITMFGDVAVRLLKMMGHSGTVPSALLARDILVGTSADPHMLRLLPPLILSTENVQRLAKALEDLTDAPL